MTYEGKSRQLSTQSAAGSCSYIDSYEERKPVPQSIAIELRTLEEARDLCGMNDSYVKLLRKHFDVGVFTRPGSLLINGESENQQRAVSVVNSLLADLRSGKTLTEDQVLNLIRGTEGATTKPKSRPLIQRLGVKARSQGQGRYVEKIESHHLTFCFGPAGTGKTFLAIAAAIRALKDGDVERIILCRPAVEAGEQLGFLPGDLQAKINPFLRPLYDALYTVLDYETVKRYQELEVIEIAPLAYMRGRTLRKAFIILDEGQNTTTAQMKMFLTRMGEESKIVVTGDTSQIDLPHGQTSGLVNARKILKHVKGIAFHAMRATDIVRHELVTRIVTAYETEEESAGKKS